MAQKLCVITGAADGIGRALLEIAVAADWHGVGVDRDQAALAEVADFCARNAGCFTPIQADLADPLACDSVIDQLKTLPPATVWIHNAGISAVGRFAVVPQAQQQAVLDVNMQAPYLLTAGILREQCLVPNGSLVFISSLSYFSGYPGASVYAASKTGLAAYARSLTWAYPRLHILTVFPGPTRTAHARRYSPDNSREDRRMPPSELAQRIWQAIDSRQRVLVPGGNAVFALLLGKILPQVSDRLMKMLMLR